MAHAGAQAGPAQRRRMAARPRRESILAAATTVFAEHGYQRTRMTDVAALVGVTEAVVFHNFGSKAKLFTVVLDRATEEMCAALAAAAEPAGSVRAFLVTFLSPEHLEQLHQHGAAGVIFVDAASLADEPLISAHAQDALTRLAEALAELLRAGQRDSSIRADLDPNVGAAWIMSMLHAQQFRARFLGSPDIEQGLADLTLATLGGGPEAEPVPQIGSPA